MLENNDLVSIYRKVKNEINLIEDDDKSIKSGADTLAHLSLQMSMWGRSSDGRALA